MAFNPKLEDKLPRVSLKSTATCPLYERADVGGYFKGRDIKRYRTVNDKN